MSDDYWTDQADRAYAEMHEGAQVAQAAEQAIALAETFRARAEVAESRLRELEFACLEIFTCAEQFDHAPDADSECFLCRALALAFQPTGDKE